jgi:hypothetical protein
VRSPLFNLHGLAILTLGDQTLVFEKKILRFWFQKNPIKYIDLMGMFCGLRGIASLQAFSILALSTVWSTGHPIFTHQLHILYICW